MKELYSFKVERQIEKEVPHVKKNQRRACRDYQEG